MEIVMYDRESVSFKDIEPGTEFEVKSGLRYLKLKKKKGSKIDKNCVLLPDYSLGTCGEDAPVYLVNEEETSEVPFSEVKQMTTFHTPEGYRIKTDDFGTTNCIDLNGAGHRMEMDARVLIVKSQLRMETPAGKELPS